MSSGEGLVRPWRGSDGSLYVCMVVAGQGSSACVVHRFLSGGASSEPGSEEIPRVEVQYSTIMRYVRHASPCPDGSLLLCGPDADIGSKESVIALVEPSTGNIERVYRVPHKDVDAWTVGDGFVVVTVSRGDVRIPSVESRRGTCLLVVRLDTGTIHGLSAQLAPQCAYFAVRPPVDALRSVSTIGESSPPYSLLAETTGKHDLTSVSLVGPFEIYTAIKHPGGISLYWWNIFSGGFDDAEPLLLDHIETRHEKIISIQSWRDRLVVLSQDTRNRPGLAFLKIAVFVHPLDARGDLPRTPLLARQVVGVDFECPLIEYKVDPLIGAFVLMGRSGCLGCVDLEVPPISNQRTPNRLVGWAPLDLFVPISPPDTPREELRYLSRSEVRSQTADAPSAGDVPSSAFPPIVVCTAHIQSLGALYARSWRSDDESVPRRSSPRVHDDTLSDTRTLWRCATTDWLIAVSFRDWTLHYTRLGLSAPSVPVRESVAQNIMDPIVSELDALAIQPAAAAAGITVEPLD